MLSGAAVQALWSVPVMRFFEAVALFGCLVLLEREQADDRGGRFETTTTLVIALTLLAVIVMNAALILNLSNSQSEEIGNTQLDVIRSDL